MSLSSVFEGMPFRVDKDNGLMVTWGLCNESQIRLKRSYFDSLGIEHLEDRLPLLPGK